MTFDELYACAVEAKVMAPGRRVALDCGEAGGFLFDGVAARLSRELGDSDATILMSAADLDAMTNGDLDPDEAFVEGRLKVVGDLSAAMLITNDLAKCGSKRS